MCQCHRLSVPTCLQTAQKYKRNLRWKIKASVCFDWNRRRIYQAKLADSRFIFMQIGDENVDRVRAVMSEVFGDQNFISVIAVQTTTGFEAGYLGNVPDFISWYAKDKSSGKSNSPFCIRVYYISRYKRGRIRQPVKRMMMTIFVNTGEKRNLTR